MIDRNLESTTAAPTMTADDEKMEEAKPLKNLDLVKDPCDMPDMTEEAKKDCKRGGTPQ